MNVLKSIIFSGIVIVTLITVQPYLTLLFDLILKNLEPYPIVYSIVPNKNISTDSRWGAISNAVLYGNLAIFLFFYSNSKKISSIELTNVSN